MKHYIKKFLLIFTITVIIGLLAVGVAFGGAVLGYWGGTEDLDIDSLTIRKNSSIVYVDDTGEEVELYNLSEKENRIWVELDGIPENLKNAFVAIEDERFYDHKGYDVKRTVKATLTWAVNKITGKGGAASLGGSTITQQLIKNITGEDEQTPARKIQEISRAAALEKKMEKEQILELYLNCIYLSQGCNGVQTAAKLYFDKDVSELNLAECASIAGITKYPSMYDPFVNPDKNKERQKIVLSKMLELNYITQQEHDEAAAAALNFAQNTGGDEEESEASTSYYVDQIIRDVLKDLQKLGYSQSVATRILYSGGVKIYTDYNPEIQKIVEEYYKNVKNFPDSKAQSSIVIIDTQTGCIAGMAGGIGEKSGSLVLSRAETMRQPGSSIKPISVYAPALDKGTITAGSIYDDKAKSYGGWTPRNSDYQYRGLVDIRRAVRSSLNTVAVEILYEMGTQTSFNYLTDELGISTLVESREIDGKLFSDIGLAQLALGGLTDGVTVLEMAAAYAPFANNGIYNTPYSYTEVKDSDGSVIVSSERKAKEVMKPSTAFIMCQLLKEVVDSGTGVGAAVSGSSYTGGKTGSTTENKDRWFIGFTPNYAAAVWYGYDTPKEINLSYNPCVPIFRNVMNKVQQTVKNKRTISQPSDIIQVSYCAYTGMRATSSCPSTSYYGSSDNIPKYCNGKHSGTPITGDEEEEDEDEDDEDDKDDKDKTSSGGSSTGSGRGSGTSGTGTGAAGSGSSGANGTATGGSGTGSSGASGSGANGSDTSGSGTGSTGTSGSGSGSNTGGALIE